MRIFLTGMMGCGKSFWGKKISEFHQLSFIDMDEYIEGKLGMSIIEVFEQKGERYFREQESYYLKEIILNHPNCIVATGGGTPCFYDNMLQMKAAGSVVYLKADTEILAQRIFNSRQSRPLIIRPTLQETAKQVETIYLNRKNIYEQSDCIINMNQIDETKFAENFMNEYL